MSNWLSLFLVVGALSLSTGCNKNAAPSQANVDAEAVQAAQSLPEGTNVLAALEKKDYDTAVATLSKIKNSLDANQESAFMTLKQHVRSVLLSAEATDPKAKDALNGLRMLTQGR